MDYFPSSSAGTTSSTETSQRPSGSSVLWAHLLRKDVLTSPAKTDLPLPPLAPVDRSATSTRILLLDTQAHLQKFGQSVDDLTSKVDSTKHEIVTVKNLFKQDREVLMNDIVDRVNRSQLEIQKSISKPAQASKLEDIQKTLEVRLETMDQRLNVMQMLHQTYSQALQNQTQVLQSLQDRQSVIISALTPLLPLLQTIPPQIEAARNDLSVSLTNFQSIYLNAISAHKNLPYPTLGSPSRKRSNTSSTAGRKRRRVDENTVTYPLPTVEDNTASSTRTQKAMAPCGRQQSQVQASYRLPLSELPLTDYGARHVSRPETPVIIPKTPLVRLSDPIARFRQGYVPPPPRQITERSPTVSIADASSSHQPSSPCIPTTSALLVRGAQAPRTIDPKSKFKPIPPARDPSQKATRSPLCPSAQPVSFPRMHAPMAAQIVSTPAPSANSEFTTALECRTTNSGLAPPTLRQRRSPFVSSLSLCHMKSNVKLIALTF
ncbi:hypothetical protein J3R30DRAFT_1226746 [Lentinula aciculospora]|uniref:Uncharacterized protein n=1 Tax=Lentinula aciculospora TaxID=153920 RepID=A0A9W9DGY0_9AGAR|nr:hypothetical protein J3R30DRAFT_1226746 [Lentinula aciculospora]